MWIAYSSTPWKDLHLVHWKDHLIKPLRQFSNASSNIKNTLIQVFLNLLVTGNAMKHLHIWNITFSTIKILWFRGPHLNLQVFVGSLELMQNIITMQTRLKIKQFHVLKCIVSKVLKFCRFFSRWLFYKLGKSSILP